jgi:outer membrane protein insertion porin family
MPEDVATVGNKRAAVIGALMVLFLFLLPMVSAAADETKVTLIEVQGNRRIEAATIRAKIKTREGEPFSPAAIKEDIRTLYQLGHFEDVQVKTEGFETGLKVIFSVKEKPLIREISFEGNDELTAEKLKEGMTLLPRTAFNQQLIDETAEKIRLKYQDSGYYSAVVVPVITENKSGDRSVVFAIEEGDLVKLADVIITGNKAISTNELKTAMKTQEDWIFSFFGRSGTLRIEELRDDGDTIRNLYYNKGYIQVQVDDPVITHPSYTFRECYFWGAPKQFTRQNELVVSINLKEGEQFRVGSIRFKGNEILSTADLEKEAKLKKGDIFSRDGLRKDVNSIIDKYDGLARPFANVVPLFDIDAQNKTVAITIDIQEGGEVRIGRINVAGNTKTRDKVIRREMRLDEGDLYSKKALRRSSERINNLNFFDTAELTPERRLKEDVMDINVKVKEKLTGQLSVGGGYSSVDRLVGIAEISEGNVGGRGQLLKLKTQIGSRSTMYNLSFMEPWMFDKPVWGRIDLYDQTQKYDGYDLRSNGLGLAAGKSFGEYVNSSLKYGLDDSQVYNVSTTAPFAVTNQITTYGGEIKTSSLTWSLARDARDFYLDPKSGSKNSLMVEYAGGRLLGGDTNFVKTIADSAWYFPMFWDTVFLARGRFGYVESLIDKPVPLAERFYVGGTSSVRGFRYGTAGPTSPVYGSTYGSGNYGTGRSYVPDNPEVSQNAIGGDKEVVFNFEYSFPIVPAARLKGVLFYDIGKGFDTYEPISFKALRQSMGWGFWWLSPIGPLKFEWGYIVNKKPTDAESQFDFSIGALF